MQDIEKYKLSNPKSFHYLNQSNCYELDGVNDADEYLATRRAMDIVGISEQEQVSPAFPFCSIIRLGFKDNIGGGFGHSQNQYTHGNR